MTVKLDAIVLAGGRNSPAMQAATGVDNRSQVVLGGKTMLSYVVEALAGAASVSRVFVIGDVPESDRYRQIAGGVTLMDNLLAGIHASGQEDTDRRVVVATSDTPFLLSASVQSFIEAGLEAEADFCYPIIPIDLCQAQFPQMKRTTLRLRDGTFTGGNLMLVNPRFVLSHEETILRAYAARKSVPQIGRLLGWSLLLRILAAQAVSPSVLSIADLEAGVGRLLGGGCRARAIITPHADIGTDVDKPEDVVIAQQMLGS